MMKVTRRIIYALVAAAALVAIGSVAVWVYKCYFIDEEPHWNIEQNAKPSSSHPLAGFYKRENCENPWGWAVGPASDGSVSYYISFCGPGGCFAEGTYRPNTTIAGDQDYRVEGQGVIWFQSNDGWTKHVRCPSRDEAQQTVSAANNSLRGRRP